MAWIPIILFVALVMVALVFVLKLQRGAWEAAAAALVLGLAGYALQSEPGQSGAPKQRASGPSYDGEALVEARRQFDDNAISTTREIVTADALARNGRFEYAANFLTGYLRENPNNSEGWTALGNALFAQAEGNLTEAATEAYRRAAIADEANPAPYFFLGLGWLTAGEFQRARELWALAFERTEEGTPARAMMEARVAQLETMLMRAGQSAESPRSETQ
jgi:cytochrome c-type biogenesis protein CcmH